MNEIIHTEIKKGVWESPYFLVVVLALGSFLTGLDAFIFIPALPMIVGDLKTSLDWVSWTMTIFLLFYTATMPLGGKLSDIYGRKRVYIAGIAIFLIGSIASSLSWNIYSLIAFRALQAIGGGLVLPAAMSALGSMVPADNRGKTMGMVMAASAMSMIIGPTIGGYIIQQFGWRMVFYINVPIGILAILLALKLRESFGEKKQHIDVIGAALLVSGLGAFMLGLVRLETLPLADMTVYPLFIVAAALVVALILFELRTREPILDIRRLARGNVLSLNLALLSMNFAEMGVIIYIPSFAQIVLHMNVQDSGTILTPLSVAIMVSSIVGGILLDKFGAKPMLLVGSVITAASVFTLAEYVNDSASLVIMLILCGVGMGLGMGAFQILMMSFMPVSEKGVGSGIMTTFQNMGSTLGSVIGGYFLAEATTKTIMINQAFNHIFWFATAIAIVAIGFIVLLILLDTFVTGHRSTLVKAPLERPEYGGLQK
jgi:EmrB/QacA subfamily drug resistance transporter